MNKELRVSYGRGVRFSINISIIDKNIDSSYQDSWKDSNVCYPLSIILIFKPSHSLRNVYTKNTLNVFDNSFPTISSKHRQCLKHVLFFKLSITSFQNERRTEKSIQYDRFTQNQISFQLASLPCNEICSSYSHYLLRILNWVFRRKYRLFK